MLSIHLSIGRYERPALAALLPQRAHPVPSRRRSGRRRRQPAAAAGLRRAPTQQTQEVPHHSHTVRLGHLTRDRRPRPQLGPSSSRKYSSRSSCCKIGTLGLHSIDFSLWKSMFFISLSLNIKGIWNQSKHMFTPVVTSVQYQKEFAYIAKVQRSIKEDLYPA